MQTSLPSTSGIYRITCTVTGKFYIGSAKNILDRRRVHLHYLRQGKHHSIALQRAFTKYGEASFEWDVLELVFIPFLLDREQYWLDTFQPFGDKGYNINRTAGSRYGTEVTPETREKLRQANLGKTYSDETRQKHADASKSRGQTEATREKVRLIRLGTKRSDETCERLSVAHLGKKQSEETRAKHSLAMTGRPVSEATRARLSESNVAGNAWRMKTLIVTAPDGTVYTAIGIGKFCKEHNLNRSALIQVAKGVHPHHKGWTARYA